MSRLNASGQGRPRAGVSDAPARGPLFRVGMVVLWLVIWQLAALAVGSRLLLASPVDTGARLAQLIVEPRFLGVVWFSMVRIVGGFAVAYVLAAALAFVGHRWPVVGELLAPGIAALKSVPIACVVVLLLIWVGSRQVSGIAVFLAVFPAVYFSCVEGLAHVDAQVSEMLAVFRVRRPVRLAAHLWPQVLPHLLGTARNVCGMAWKAGVAAELIGSPAGSMGERIYQAKVMLETADLFAWTIVVIALSAVCERVFVALLGRSGRASQRLALRLARRGGASASGRSASGKPATSLKPAGIMLSKAAIGYGEPAVATGIDLKLTPGARVVLTDASGLGKTTLLRTVAALQPLLDGSAVLPPTVSMTFQEARLIEGLSAVENVALVAEGLSDDEIHQALGELLPADALDVPVASLSGGQRRRVEITRALLASSAAVLLDEPFASLDEDTHRTAAAFVARHLAGRTLVVASHAPGDANLLDATELRVFDAPEVPVTNGATG